MSRAVGRVVEAVASPFVAAGKAVGSAVGGVVRGAGQVLKGAGQILTGDFKEGLHSMFIKSTGEAVGGLVGAGKHLFGNPVTAFLTGGALMLGTGGTAGFLLAGAGSALFGGGTSEALGNLQQGIYNWTGVNQPEGQCHKSNNECKLGKHNGQCSENPGITLPPGMPPQFYPQNPNYAGPQMPPGYCPPGYGQQQDPMQQMMMMSTMMSMMSSMAMMLPMMSSMGGGNYNLNGNAGLNSYFSGGQFNAMPGNYGPGSNYYLC